MTEIEYLQLQLRIEQRYLAVLEQKLLPWASPLERQKLRVQTLQEMIAQLERPPVQAVTPSAPVQESQTGPRPMASGNRFRNLEM